MNGRFFTVLFLLTTFYTKAQDQLTFKEVVTILQRDTRFEDGGADWVQFEEQLNTLYFNKISLNTSTQNELEAIPFLTPIDVYNLLQFRRKTKRICSYYELLQVKGFDKQRIQILQYFTTLQQKKREITPKKVFKEGRHLVASGYDHIFQQKRGFTDTNRSFLGDATAWHLRYRLNYYNRVFFGFTLQKDAGEPYPGNFPYIADFSSVHLEVRFNNVINKLVIGDFYANYGQGLSLWSGITFGKMAYTTDVQRFGKGVGYYSGADENRFFRGVAVQFKHKQLTLDVFASGNKHDATINNGLAQSLVTTGLHRTRAEIEKSANQTINVVGSHLTYSGNTVNLGLTAYQYSYQFPFLLGNHPYQQYNFYGNKNTVVSSDFSWVIAHGNVFGEFSYSQLYQKAAGLFGIKLKPVDRFNFVLLLRSVPSGYHTLYSSPFSESGNDGEQGAYLGIEFQLSTKWKLNAYADRYTFNWLRYNLPFKSHGEDYLLQLNYSPNTQLTTYVRYRNKRKAFASEHNNTYHISELDSHNWRWNLIYRVHKNVLWNSRLELKSMPNYPTAFLMYQDLSYSFPNTALSIDFRINVFASATYLTTIYAREDDLPYSYNLAQFNNEGTKSSLRIRYRIKQLELWLRYSHNKYPNLQVVGSGVDEIKGNELTRIKVLVRWHI